MRLHSSLPLTGWSEALSTTCKKLHDPDWLPSPSHLLPHQEPMALDFPPSPRPALNLHPALCLCTPLSLSLGIFSFFSILQNSTHPSRPHGITCFTFSENTFYQSLCTKSVSIALGFIRKPESQALIPDLVNQNLPFSKIPGALHAH